ncbi:hypothetical protein RJ640_020475 [Escallonia rubra]|uniref:Squalene cyclase N-terminal domain-containing protein n=1 Tax=Escallonia rubra TaxID=112253 RepID=A0AA88R1W6_9ASTE|nr:hypothetical protein RJ640_020475 [Escallonia rubra]
MWKLILSKGDDDPVESKNDHLGRQFWEFDPNLGTPEERAQVEKAREEFHNNRFHVKHSSDLLMRLQFEREHPGEMELPAQVKVGREEDISEEAVETTLRRALRYYSTLQAEDGHWPGDYAGPLFLLPGLVIGLSVIGALDTGLPENHQREICRYLYNHQNVDGGWGLHIEGCSTMFSTTLTYVTLRLLGQSMTSRDGALAKARKWILDHGGATYIPSWGKLWLSVSILEWLCQNCLHFAQKLKLKSDQKLKALRRMWCHCRMVYLPMSYLYGKRFVGRINSTVLSLRRELYTHAYHEINWDIARNECAKEDLYYPHPLIQDMLWGGLNQYIEPLLMHWPFAKLREKALTTVMQHIHYEDENTKYICIGPVNKVLNMVCCWVEDPNSTVNKFHLSRVKDYLWMSEDGMKMQGYNGSQLWDVVFAVQAILETNLIDKSSLMLRRAHEYIKNSQDTADISAGSNSWYRHTSEGGWPFSTLDNGWVVSDCTAEGLKVKYLPNDYVISVQSVGDMVLISPWTR